MDITRKFETETTLQTDHGDVRDYYEHVRTDEVTLSGHPRLAQLMDWMIENGWGADLQDECEQFGLSMDWPDEYSSDRLEFTDTATCVEYVMRVFTKEVETIVTPFETTTEKLASIRTSTGRWLTKSGERRAYFDEHKEFIGIEYRGGVWEWALREWDDATVVVQDFQCPDFFKK